MSADLTLGFLGAGKMATALARGFIRAGVVPAERILASDPFPAARGHFTKETGARSVESNAEAAAQADVLILAVKPDQVVPVLTSLRDTLRPDALVLSIAAGVPLAKMESALPPGARAIRVMPNTPALVGKSATAFACGSRATDADAALAEKLFSAVGVALQVKEPLMDAVTGLSGSGPAYAFVMIEALADGGVGAGLPREVATRLAAQTLLGAAAMVLETGQHPGALKDAVASPGGTTIDGLHELEKGSVRKALINAVRAAAEKSRKLA
jgi:pyrroline-5-carboxylate reductase